MIRYQLENCSLQNSGWIKKGIENQWQENFDIDATGQNIYDILVIHSLQDMRSIDFSILEDISHQIVIIKSGGKAVGTLAPKAAFIITSNKSPDALFGH